MKTLKQKIDEAEQAQSCFDDVCEEITQRVNQGKLQPKHQEEIIQYIESNFLNDIRQAEDDSYATYPGFDCRKEVQNAKHR